MGKDLALDAKKGDSSNRLAMIHTNLSQLRVTVNDDSVFDSPLKFHWQCSEGEADVNSAKTYYYDYNKSSYLRGYNLVQEIFGKTYGTEIPITASDFCNNYFLIPINLNLHRQIDNEKFAVTYRSITSFPKCKTLQSNFRAMQPPRSKSTYSV